MSKPVNQTRVTYGYYRTAVRRRGFLRRIAYAAKPRPGHAGHLEIFLGEYTGDLTCTGFRSHQGIWYCWNSSDTFYFYSVKYSPTPWQQWNASNWVKVFGLASDWYNPGITEQVYQMSGPPPVPPDDSFDWT
jgi:hypothetical protein